MLDRTFLRQGCLAILLGLFFSALYIHAVEIHPQSHILAQAHFDVPYPFRMRFLLPVLLGQLMHLEQADTNLFRFIFASIFVAGTFMLFPCYLRRLRIEDIRVQRISSICLLLVLLAHYVLTRTLNVYYIYDMPSIFFYLITFLLLTEERFHLFLLGLPLLVLLSFNRETIVVAALHAFGYLVFMQKTQVFAGKFRLRLLLLAAAVAGIFITRHITASIMNVDIFDTVKPYDENNNLRFIGNIVALHQHPAFILQIPLIGCGLFFWLPFFLRKLTAMEKVLMLSSLPAFLMLLWVGNFIELRTYNEFVPLLAVVLANAVTYALSRHRLYRRNRAET